MGAIKEKLADIDKRNDILNDCANLVDSEVKSKKGAIGFLIRGGYKAFTAIKPTIVYESMDVLIDRFAPVMDSHFKQYSKLGIDTGFVKWAIVRDIELADDLLKVTDDIMEQSAKIVLKKIYSSLRGIARKHVAIAMPRISLLVKKYSK